MDDENGQTNETRRNTLSDAEFLELMKRQPTGFIDKMNSFDRGFFIRFSPGPARLWTWEKGGEPIERDFDED